MTDLIVNLLLEEPVPVVKLRPDVPAKLVQLLTRLLAKQVDQRPNHADEVVEALQAIEEDLLAAHQLQPRPSGFSQPPVPLSEYPSDPAVMPSRRPWWMFLFGLMMLAITATGAYWMFQHGWLQWQSSPVASAPQSPATDQPTQNKTERKEELPIP